MAKETALPCDFKTVATPSASSAPSASALALKASLVGANTVKFGVWSTARAKPVLTNKSTRVVNPAAIAVLEILSGMVKTLSMMWTMPPAKETSYSRR